jgi:hypothetical protein
MAEKHVPPSFLKQILLPGLIKTIVLITILMFRPDSAIAQITTFSTNHEEFLTQFKERFEATSDKKRTKDFLDQFYRFWLSPDLTPQSKDLIIKTLNQLNQKKATPFPDLETYLLTFRSFILHNHPKESFENWHRALNDYIQKPRISPRHVNLFLNTSKELVSSNIIYSTPSTSWVSKSNNFKYEYDGTTIRLDIGTTTLICRSQNDSIIVYDTKGTFYPLEETWKGESGKVNWERAGFSPDAIYATFKNYSIKMDKPYFTVDSVEFFNRQFFSYPIKGNLEHKVMSVKNPESATYPKFTSHDQWFKIDNIHPNMFYEGGFAQYGAKFLGAGTTENPATIRIFRNDTLFITARSLYFALRQDQIQSNDTEITVNLDSFKIYHPGLIFKYLNDSREIHLIRNGEGLSKSPYFDTYHNISLDVELFLWKMDKPIIELKMLSGAAENHAFFESLSYFREAFYNQLQGMDAMHPLQALKNCARYFHGKPFTAAEYAKFIGFPEHQVRQQAMALSFYGFVSYNVNTDVIEVQERLDDYLMFRLGKKDYDVIRFNSTTPGKEPNAVLDLLNYDLQLNGVSNISICDHQNVIFFPRNEKILLKQNRNFAFDGTINAGMLNLYGDGFRFDYDQFRIDLKTIDSLKMQVQTGDLDYLGKPSLAYVNNTIAQLSGYLQIDEPNNKSGTKQNPHFPILKSTKESYVFYDRSDIQKGAYKKEKFYFKLDTFELDSVNTLLKRNFQFSGEFTSGIFPNFRDRLTVMEDYSLGFKRSTPSGGFPIYNGNAKFTNTIHLSNNGLRGNGVINYLTTTIASQDFLFLPDAVKGQAQDFTIAKQTKGVPFPDVHAKHVSIEYLPYANQLITNTIEENFTLYNKEGELKGDLVIAPTGLRGKGTFYLRHGNIYSPSYDFGDHSFVADSSNFNLTGTDVEGVSFATTNLISTIDFETRQGTFVSKTGGSRVDFTENRFISFINQFSWDMDKNDIYMGLKGSKGNRFISVHKKQDSLDFYVPLARYDVEQKLIEAEEVKNIRVADANIYLKDGIVRIREDAVIDPLDGTTVVINDSLHTIYDANVHIEGKYAYQGKGKYDYINGDDKRQTIIIDRFTLDQNKKTTAEGNIKSEDFFTFDSHFAYKGKAQINGSDTLLTFDGGVQILHPCSTRGPQSFMRFTSKINPKKIAIPVNDDLLTTERENLFRDFFMKKDSTHIYSSFLEGRKNYSDIQLLTGNGFLYHNTTNRAFEIASMDKINRPDTTGTVLRFTESDCNVTGEGKINMGIELDQIKTNASGTILHLRDENTILLSTLFTLDFFFAEKATISMIADLTMSKAKPSTLSANTYEKRLAEITNKKIARQVQADRATPGETKNLPTDLQHLFNFGNIDWKWNTGTTSYIANGNAELIFIKNHVVNREVMVKAEYMRKRSGNSIDLYIEAGPETWYYFSFKNGSMQALSSNQDFNNIVQTLKQEERKQKTGMGEKPFIFIMGTKSKKDRFVKRINDGINNVSEGDDVEETSSE